MNASLFLFLISFLITFKPFHVSMRSLLFSPSMSYNSTELSNCGWMRVTLTFLAYAPSTLVCHAAAIFGTSREAIVIHLSSHHPRVEPRWIALYLFLSSSIPPSLKSPSAGDGSWHWSYSTFVRMECSHLNDKKTRFCRLGHWFVVLGSSGFSFFIPETL